MQRQYIFTKNGFYPENTGEEIEDEEVAEFLYDIGNIESPSKLLQATINSGVNEKAVLNYRKTALSFAPRLILPK